MRLLKKPIIKRKRPSVRVTALALSLVIAFSGIVGFPLDFIFTAHAEIPAQTYTIYSAQDLIDYSLAYATDGANKNDVLRISINEGSTVSDDGFISIGKSSYPFSGTIILPTTGVDIFHLFDCPLFDYVSTDLKIEFAGSSNPGTIKIMREAASDTPSVGVLTSGALFANHVVAGNNPADWRVSLLAYDGEGNESSSYSGLIGEIAAGANVSVTFTNTSSIPVSGDGNIGLICGTLNAGASLSVTTAGSGSDLSVSSSGGHAGGLVGEMKSGSTLKFNSANLSRVNSVSSSAGYAGGVVGCAENITVLYDDGVSDYAVSGGVTGTTGAGGVFGKYITTAPDVVFTLKDTFMIDSGMRVSSTTYTGGVFGLLENRGASFAFDGNTGADPTSPTEAINVNLAGGSYRGGVCGGYQTNALANTFELYNTATTVTASYSGSGNSAGLIGTLTSSPAYVNIHDVACTSGGAPNGGLIGTTGSGGSFADVTGNITVTGCFDAGLIANMPSGVLRMGGMFDLSGYNQYDNASGFLVKTRSRALIYAPGDGSGTNGNWTFKRNTNCRIDDIHSWGEVIRADGTILDEEDIVTVDMSAHTVTVKPAVTSMSDVTDFADTALNIKLNTGDGVGALQFTSGSANSSAALLAGTLSLGGDIDLSDTGLLGLTRDDGGNAPFTGTFNGNGHTITFATGENYGVQGNGSALDSSSKQGYIFQHTYNGLFAEISNAAVNNLTVSGVCNFHQTANNLRHGGIAAYATDGVSLSGVTANYTVNAAYTDDFTAYYGGAFAVAGGTGLNISVTGSTLRPTFKDSSSANGSNIVYVGGAIGLLNAAKSETAQTSTEFTSTQTVNFSSSAVLGLDYQKTGSANKVSCFGSAIAGVANCIYTKDKRQITFNGVTVDLSVTGANSRDRKLGAILGMDWYAADVTISDLTVDSSISAAGAVGDFGGLVRTATGRWDVQKLTLSAADFALPTGSTFGFISNKTSVNGSGSAKSALYLDVDNTGSNYDIAALAFTNSPTFTVFDEIAADSRFNGQNITNNGNSVISITTSGNVINTTGAVKNTYLNKTAYGKRSSAAAKINPYTRYYYNVKYARANTATEKYNFFIWSVKTYAHSSLAAWFPSSASFTGDLDMCGISYYPVNLKEGVTFTNATVTLDNDLMESYVNLAYTGETGRTTRANTNQHYLMHTAVFRNAPSSAVNASGLTLVGNVPRLSDGFCGFFIAGTLGNSETGNARCTVSDLTLDGAHIITDAGAMLTSDTYAPLFINNVGKNTSLTVDGAAQSASAYSSYNAGGYYAASSLIGDVGSASARAIYLTFTDLKFDGRSSAASIGNLNTVYGTQKSIFSRATILNSFLYAGESAGSYNYEIGEDWVDSSTAIHNVTYGKEVTSSLEYQNKEKNYYGSEYYTHPTVYQSGSEYSFASGFLPYVYVAYNLSEKKHELSVNVTFNSEIEGFGKYDKPYIIDDDEKLPIISKIINGVDVGASVVIHLPGDLTSYDYAATGYGEYTYNFGTDNFTSTDGGTTRSNANVRRYLAGAYYVITKNITLPADYISLGEVDDNNNSQYAFRGVLIGRNITITNNSPNPLIHTSMGSVVKDITLDVDVDYNDGDTDVELAAPDGDDEYKFISGIQSYGAVMGQILGGDSIIDNVHLTFTDISFNITASSGAYQRLTPIGGYVGTLFGGGLVFRNMTLSDAGLTDSETGNLISDAGYLYVNPIIGRVINGYAFHELVSGAAGSITLDNGDKNYEIPDLSLAQGKLTVEDNGSQYTVTVPDGQAMFILGAIVNSGAASANTGGDLTSNITAYQGLTGFWQAYRAHTAARANASYGFVGDTENAGYAADLVKAKNDKYSNNANKVPYVVRVYTVDDDSATYARSLSRRANNIVNITGSCDVPSGFRGIGCFYYDSDYVRLGVQKVNGNSKTVTLDMSFEEYDPYTVKSYKAPANTAGFGLFNVLKMSSASSSNSINNLTLAGSVFYDVLQVASGAQSAYKFKLSADGVYYESVLSVGGLIGHAMKTKYYLKKVTMDGLSVDGARYTGGLIGFTGDSEGNQSVIDSCGTGSSASGVSVCSGVAAGGLVGYVLGVVKVCSDAAGSGVKTRVMIDKVEIKCLNTTDSIDSQPDNNKESLKWLQRVWVFGAGGLIGLIQPRAMDKTSITNYTISGKSGNEKHVFSTSESEANQTRAGGVFGITKNRNINFTNVDIEDLNVVAAYAGGVVGSGFTDKNDSNKLKFVFVNVTLDGKNNAASRSDIDGFIASGGVVGNMEQAGNGGGVFTIDNSVVRNYNITSSSATNTGNQTAGGFLGYSNPKNSSGYVLEATIRNFHIEDCAISNASTGNKNTNGTGGLFGAVLRTNVLGYNVFISGTSITAAREYQRTATIIGNNRDAASYVRLVGVSALLESPTSATTKSRNVGNANTGGTFTEKYGQYTVSSTQHDGYIVFADFNGVQSHTSFAGINDGTVNSDDYNDVAAADPYVTSNPHITAGSVTMTGDGAAASVDALAIQDILADTATGRYQYAASSYYSGSSGATNFAAFNAYTGKLAMFSSEVSGYLDTDFPVLILDDTTPENSHKMINSYIRMLTNTRYDYGEANDSVYKIQIYNMVYAEGAFSAKATGASLQTRDNKFIMRNTLFDSGKTQFSLIDVRFFDPAASGNIAYHLYIPVFVKKVLSFSFDVATLSETNFLTSLYTSRFGQPLIENIGMPVTLFFRYTYSRTPEEWAEAINAGENVHRNYAKNLMFYKANTNDILQHFPADTILVLADINDGNKPYYARFADALSGNTLNLGAFRSSMTADGAGGYIFGGDSFAPRDLDEMMVGLTATRDDDGTLGGTLIPCDDEYATVNVSGQGYRAATDEEMLDGSIKKYVVSLSSMKTEDYYLSIYTESNAANDLLFHYYLITTPSAFNDAEHPSKILDTGSHTMVHLVMGKIFYHDNLAISSRSYNSSNGNTGTEIMTSSNNGLEVTLSAEFGLSDALDADIKAAVQTQIAATNVYQSFLVYLNHKENLDMRKEILGNPDAAGAYSVDYDIDQSGSADTSYTAANIRLTQNYAEFITGDLKNYFASGNHFEVVSTVSLEYSAEAIPTQFPGRSELPPSDDNGVKISGASNIAFQHTATTYSKNTIDGDDTTGHSYYSESHPEVATLGLSPIGDKVGDFTPLGINALNINNATIVDFDLLASLDISAISDRLTDDFGDLQYSYAQVTVQLAQKQADGSYGESLDISQYMTVRFDGVGDDEYVTPHDSVSYTEEIPRTNPNLSESLAEIDLPIMHCRVLTGSALEAAGFTYGNYRVTVTVALLTESHSKIMITQASNYVIYTNAKIIPGFIS